MTHRSLRHPRPKGQPPPAMQLVLFWSILIALLCRTIDAYDIVFTKAVYNASVPENALGNTAVISDYKIGILLPADTSYNIKYKITSGDPNNFFKTNSRLVGDFCFLEINVRTGNRKVLNRESRSFYLLNIKAQLRRHDRTKLDIPKAVTLVNVSITDLNDISPLFLDTHYEVRLDEDTPLYTSVARVKAEDPDEGLNGEIYYSFKESTPTFAIHPTSAVVSLTRPLNHIEKSRYTLTIEARDRGLRNHGSWPSVAFLTVNVTGSNVQAPIIEVHKLTKAVPTGYLMVMAIVNVFDADRGIGGEIKSVEIDDGDPDRIFRILPGASKSEFNLAALKTLDWDIFPNGFNLSIKATDNGANPRFSYKMLKILPPPQPTSGHIFLNETFEIGISEIYPPGTKVVDVSAALPGAMVKVTFAITSGNEDGYFELDSRSGVLWTVRHFDDDSKPKHHLTITAVTSGIFRHVKQNSANVFITILDANDRTPIIVAPQGTVTVEEHQSTGSWVTQVRAQDYDYGENKHVTYSISNENVVPFAIDPFTGNIRTTKVLDYETQKRVWKLKVRASDWGKPFRRQSEKTIVVKLLDVNDNRPQFEEIDCSGLLDRYSPIGMDIHTFSALDFDDGNIISYRIVSGNSDRCFHLDSSLGILSLGCDLGEMGISARTISVAATDGQHFSDTVWLKLEIVTSVVGTGKHVRLKCRKLSIAEKLKKQREVAARNNPIEEDINFSIMTPPPPPNAYSPVVSAVPVEVRLRENSDPGTYVVRVAAKDNDFGYDGLLLYTITGGNRESVFEIDINSGDIIVAGILDRERVPRYTLNVTVYDLGVPQKSASLTVSIALVDENDNFPEFDRTADRFFLPEIISNGTTVYQLHAEDPDEGVNGVISYSLETDTKDFYVDPVNGMLIVSHPLDYEVVPMYELRVAATDGGGNSAYAYVTVELFDFNDCAPTFPEGGFPPVKVSEDFPVGALVAIVTAYDPDSTELKYTLDSTTYPFQLDERTAALRLSQPLDYETKSIYNISISVSDGENLSKIYLLIQVVDVNENIHAPVFGNDVIEAEIRENSPPNTLVTSAPARDGDLNLADSSIHYSLLGDEGLGLFYIDQSGNIYTSAYLDRETRGRYWLTVKAEDSGSVPRHAILHVYVVVKDINDNRPLSEWPVYSPAVPENSHPGTYVATVVATDPDQNEEGLFYSISAGNPQSLFEINEKTGEISTTERRLDREQQSEHFLRVQISDGRDSSTALSSTTYVIVKVTDENDNKPEFLDKIYTIPVPWYSKTVYSRLPNSNHIGQVIASDLDEGSNGDISYNIIDDHNRNMFKIHPKTGIIYAETNLRPGQSYKLTAEAIDKGVPPRRSTCLVVINVVAVPQSSRNPPKIFGSSRINVTIAETSLIGSLVRFIDAADDDNDKLWFEIVEGNEDGVFSIGRGNGNIILAKSLDAEEKDFYQLKATVTDGPHFVAVYVGISVIDVNDNRPAFTKLTYDMEVRENTNPGSVIYTLTANDSDVNKRLSFFLENTADTISSSLFRISETTGDIILLKRLDRENLERHILTVGVKDIAIPEKSNFARVIINVLDYNDQTPRFTTQLYNGTVLDTAEVGVRILQVVAFDNDRGANGYITYSITSGNIGDKFRLDPESGTLFLAREVSKMRMAEYWLAIKATDSGSPSKHSHTNVNILVKTSTDNNPRFLEKEYVFEVEENSRIGSYVGVLQADSHLGVVYTMAESELPFAINPSSGVLSIIRFVDYEILSSYNVSIKAVAMIGKKSVTNAIINILDVNDNVPIFVKNKYDGHVSEAAATGSVVLMEDNKPLVVLAKDADSGRNSNLFYTIVDDEANLYFNIDSTTGAIRTIGPIDHEVISEIEFRVIVHDSGTPKLSSQTSAAVRIVITDINDVPPRFLQQKYNAILYTPTGRNVNILQLNATDLDIGTNNSLKYSLVSGNEENSFKMDALTGLISVNNTDFLQESYKLKATVSDGYFASSTTVNVKIENLPKSNLRFAKSKYLASVRENTTETQTVVMVQVIGNELQEHLYYSILNPSQWFTIGETSGVVKTTGMQIDREENSSHHLLVEVKSAFDTVPKRMAHVPVDIIVVDVNDNAPIFVNTPYYAVVPVASEVGSVVFQVETTDFDTNENSQIKYEMMRGRRELFYLKPATGEIIILQTLQNLPTEHNIRIRAYDDGKPPLSSEAMVYLKIVDQSQPIFDKQFYTATVSEDADLHTPVATVRARSQLQRKILYAVVDGDDYQSFGIEHEQGVIRVENTLDFETEKFYQLIVRAIDSHSSKYADVVVSIQVTDVNDNHPEMAQYFYNITVSEATSIATPILQITSTDGDSGVNAKASYSLQGINGTLPDHFYMDSSSGMLMLKRGLDREKESVHHFLVYATDFGSPSLSSSAHVYVTVSDMNDNPPLFGQPSYHSYASEVAYRRQFLSHVSAFDPDESDESRLKYSITAGNDFQAFAINSSTGNLIVWNHQRLNKRSEHLLNVSVTDGVFTKYARVLVSILPVNSHSPVFLSNKYEANVVENQLSDTFVLKVSAVDEDTGLYGTVTYHFVGDEAPKYLRLVESTGEIWTVKTFDRELKDRLRCTVMAMDIGGRTGFSNLIIKIDDENDNKPMLMVRNYEILMKPNATKDTLVMQFIASDQDEGRNGRVRYQFLSSTPSDVRKTFDLNEDTGELRLASDVIKFDELEFLIEALDSGKEILSTSAAVAVRVVDGDVILPEFLSSLYAFTVPENTAIGSTIGSVRARYHDELVYEVKWSYPDRTPPVRVSGGDMILRAAVDAESNRQIYLMVSTHPKDQPELVVSTVVLLEIQDYNDESPVFESSNYYVSMAENSPFGSHVLKISAHDKDSGRNGEVHYVLEEKHPLDKEPLFTLDPHSGWLSLNGKLDCEVKSEYKLTAVATDFGSPPLSGRTSIIVKVIDYNDTPLKFSRKKYFSSVTEDALPGTVVVELSVKDGDLSASTNSLRRQFYITEGNTRQRFDVRSSGHIYVAKSLDRETKSSYDLEVTVTDGVFTSTAQVFVEILDVNDNAPICTKPRYQISVSEDSVVGTHLLKVSVFDPDTSSSPHFYLSGLGSDNFVIHPTTGKINILKPLDREKQSQYHLRVTVRDSGSSNWECSSYVKIDISDVNDNAPIFSQRSFSVNVAENSAENLLIMKIHASDPDVGKNKKVTYSLSPSKVFSLDRETGILAVHQSLDREEQAMYNLTVTAMDHGNVRHISTASILVLVTDVNDNPPQFASDTYFTTVAESSPIGTDIVRVVAVSRDSGKNAEITYSIIGGNEHRKFAIHHNTGVVTIVNQVDFERASTYLLAIQAEDGGTPSLVDHAIININISDVNDNRPVFIQNSYSALANEAAPIGEMLIQVIASDQDSGDFGEVAYAISGGNPTMEFRINKYSGWISVAGPLDREKRASYSLKVIAIDKGVPSQSGSVMVEIDILDANDNPPLFSSLNNTAYVQEDKLPDHLVYKFEVTDNDSDKAHNGGPFTFQIRSGNNEGRFIITQNGQLRTALGFDRQIKDLYRLHIRVYDNGRPTLHSDTWINVKIIEASQFEPVISPLYITAYIEADNYQGGVIGRVQASDEDAYDTLEYGLVPIKRKRDAKYFKIDSQDGTLSAMGNLNEGTYLFNVSVSDGKFTSVERIEVSFHEIEDKLIDGTVPIELQGATAEEFLLSYTSSFHRAMKNILNVKLRDVVIVSIDVVESKSRRANPRHPYYSFKEGRIMLLFAVKKSKNSYFSRKYIRKRVQADRKLLEGTLGLSVVSIAKDQCEMFTCKNGDCKEVIELDDSVVKVSTNAISFVAPNYRHEPLCVCPPGYSGKMCETVVNKCAFQPCPSYQRCIPEESEAGYACKCPKSLIGPTCAMKRSDCIGKEQTSKCYSPLSPLSLGGKSYAQYLLRFEVDREIRFSVWFRTLYSSGNILFIAGQLDYNILEINNGILQFRWNLGSGEKLIKIVHERIDDGFWHFVVLKRSRNSAVISLDNSWTAEGSSSGESELLNMEIPHLYLGAEVRPWLDEGIETYKGFVGCMDNPLVENEVLPVVNNPSNAVASLVRSTRITPHCFKELLSAGPCGSMPCLNGGTCEEREDTYHCHCTRRFDGHFCEVDKNPCASSPCLNGGNCLNDGPSFRCECPSLVSGPRCQYMYCNPNPCLNEGLCEEGVAGPVCKCKGFMGTYCNVDINECEKLPCREGGTCFNTYGGFKCMCPHNFTGLFCDVPAAAIIFPIGINEMIYIGIGACFLVLLSVIICLTVYCRGKKARRQEALQNHVVLNSKSHENHHNHYNRNSKLSNIEVSQNCTLRNADPYPVVPNEPMYIPLNNFDTIRSYGSAGDELESLSPYGKDFIKNISKQNLQHSRNSSIGTSFGNARSSPNRSFFPENEPVAHRPWKDALANNLKDTYYDIAKIQNDVKFNQNEYFNLKNTENPDRKSKLNDSSVRSGTPQEDMPGYHWDCSDWVRQSQNPLPNILEIPVGEVRDSASFHSNESNESIVIRPLKPHLSSGGGGRISKHNKTSTVEYFSECDTDFDLNISRPDLDISQTFDIGSGEESEVSLFVPHPKRYEAHPNQYLPRHHVNSESEAEDERIKFLHHVSISPANSFKGGKPYIRQAGQTPFNKAISTASNGSPQKLKNVTEYSPPQAKNNRRFNCGKTGDPELRNSLVIGGDAEYEEGLSLFAASIASDGECVCDIDDSEVNSEFETDK